MDNQLILTSLAESADLPLQPDGRDSEQSGSARSTGSAGKSSPKTFWPTPNVPNGGRTMKPEDIMAKGKTANGKRQVGLENVVKLLETSETSTDETLPTSPSSPADFLASLSVALGSDEARRMTAISGRKCCALLRKHDLFSSLQKMLLESSTWNSTRCYLTWRPSATPRGRLLFQLAVSMPRTDETGSGLWATPTMEGFDAQGHRGTKDTLHSQVKLWPTPTARDHKDTGDCENVE